jgi:hypothetical protein
MDLSSVHKRSTRSLVFTLIFCWFFGGYYVADGVQRLLQDRLAYRWPSSFLFGSAYIGVGIFFTATLLRRIPSESPTSHEVPSDPLPPADRPETR